MVFSFVVPLTELAFKFDYPLVDPLPFICHSSLTKISLIFFLKLAELSCLALLEKGGLPKNFKLALLTLINTCL
jgi:hypothetical protein